jgi:hypothetical protein
MGIAGPTWRVRAGDDSMRVGAASMNASSRRGQADMASTLLCGVVIRLVKGFTRLGCASALLWIDLWSNLGDML